MFINKQCFAFKVPSSKFKVPSSMFNVQCSMFNSERGTRNSELGTQNPEPGTRNPEPKTRNLELGTWNLYQGKSRGLSLIELIVFIVVVSAAVAGVLGALNMATRASVEPMIQKQALAIAEAVLEEVQLMPFTYCDPDDANAETALNAGACATTTEAIGAEGVDAPPTGPAESRAGTVRPFDNVNDYHNFSMSGITNIENVAIPGLGDYKAEVTVAAQALGPGATPPVNIPSSDAQLITVTVTWPAAGPATFTVVLHGYRVRYAPNALP